MTIQLKDTQRYWEIPQWTAGVGVQRRSGGAGCVLGEAKAGELPAANRLCFLGNSSRFTREWLNGYDFVGATRLNPKAKDVMTSRVSDPTESVFEIPQSTGAPSLKITGFSSFVTTRASAYCFLPSITALKFIANLPER